MENHKKELSIDEIERVWKDHEYRQKLTRKQLKDLPANPAGEVELDDAELSNVIGSAKVASSACLI